MFICTEVRSRQISSGDKVYFTWTWDGTESSVGWYIGKRWRHCWTYLLHRKIGSIFGALHVFARAGFVFSIYFSASNSIFIHKLSYLIIHFDICLWVLHCHRQLWRNTLVASVHWIKTVCFDKMLCNNWPANCFSIEGEFTLNLIIYRL